MEKNLLIQSAKHPRNDKGLWTLLDVFVLLPLFYIMLSIPVALVLDVVNKVDISNYTLITLRFSSGTLILQFLTMILAVWLVTMITEKRSFISYGLDGHHKLKKYIFGFYIGFMMITFVTFMILLLGGGKVDPSYLKVSGIKALPTILIMLVGWIVQGAAEEIVTRGFILSKLSYRFHIFFAVLISSTVFSLLHIGNEGIGALPLINLSLFGLFAALYSLYEEGILGICALHSAWNFFQGNIYGFLVSGQSPKGGSLIGVIASDKTLINGGEFGPEGGIIVTVVLSIAAAFMLILIIKKERKNTSEEVLNDNEHDGLIYFKADKNEF
jgi:hypothetical protein